MIDIDTPIEKLEFSQRTTKALCDFGFKTFRDIVTATQWQMLRIPNIGRKSYNEIREVLAYHDCRFDMQEFKLAKDNLANEWQPIETAPKDGTNILVSGPMILDKKELKFGTYIEIARWERDCWCIKACRPQYGANPKYWMPLPEAPK